LGTELPSPQGNFLGKLIGLALKGKHTTQPGDKAAGFKTSQPTNNRAIKIGFDRIGKRQLRLYHDQQFQEVKKGDDFKKRIMTCGL